MKVGIVCDDWKVARYEEELKARKLIYTVTPLTGQLKGTTAVKFYGTKEQGAEITTKIEGEFNQHKAKNN